VPLLSSDHKRTPGLKHAPGVPSLTVTMNAAYIELGDFGAAR